MKRACVPAIVVCCLSGGLALGDQVQMRNGDHYLGQVLSLSKDTLVIQSAVLGTLRLPRHQVAAVEFGPAPAPQVVPLAGLTNPTIPPRPLTATNSAGDFSAAFRQLGGNSNLLEQVQNQYLNDAGPEAKAKFNELLGGFLTGKLSVSDIRAQAQTTADQVRSLRKDLGEDAGSMIDGYLAILDTFLKETAPPQGPGTNAPVPPPRPKVPAAPDE